MLPNAKRVAEVLEVCVDWRRLASLYPLLHLNHQTFGNPDISANEKSYYFSYRASIDISFKESHAELFYAVKESYVITF